MITGLREENSRLGRQLSDILAVADRVPVLEAEIESLKKARKKLQQELKERMNELIEVHQKVVCSA